MIPPKTVPPNRHNVQGNVMHEMLSLRNPVLITSSEDQRAHFGAYFGQERSTDAGGARQATHVALVTRSSRAETFLDLVSKSFLKEFGKERLHQKT